MQMAEAAFHIQYVRHLYKSILRLHRGLSTEMQILGDEYIREEFKRHKNVKPEAAKVFINEWTHYAMQLSQQLGIRGPRAANKVGVSLTYTQLDHFQPEQLYQLYELQQEAFKAYGKLNPSNENA